MGPLQRKLVWLIVSRAALLVALLVIAFFLGHSTKYAQAISVLALIVLALSLLYGFALRIGVSPRLFVPVQLVVDVVLTTWLVYQTDDLSSPFLALYLVVIFAASLLTSRVHIVVITVLAILALSTLTGALLAELIYRVDGTLYTPDLAAAAQVSFGFALVAMLAVATLSTHLADRQRRADIDLASATRSLADLRAFNERIIESMRSGLVTTDLEGRITTFNRAAEEITGYTAERAIGLPLADLFHGIEAMRYDGERLDKGVRLERSDVTFKRPNGTVAKLGFTMTPLTDVDGNVQGVVLIFQDVTEVFELEQEVRRQEKLAALGALAAGLAHEIRNPLASMRGSVQVLAGEVEFEQDQKRLMEIILRESERLNRTVTEFLAYARPAPFSPTEFDLKRSIADAVALLRNSSELQPDHKIREIYPEAGAPFYGDSNQIRQVFWNLARNALQAMPSGGTMTVILEPLKDGGYRLEIADEGIGMEREQVNRVFEPFASKRHGGTGLGMAIVYQFIKDHGGKITIDSTPGAGTRIHVTLPGRPAHEESAPAHTPGHANSTAG
jgi:two-component system sensor histidine kinase PilS (NtrC family)